MLAPFFVLLLACALQPAGAAPTDARKADADTQSNEWINRRIFRFIDSLATASDINRKAFEAHLGLQPKGSSVFRGNKFLRYAYKLEGAWGYLFTVKDVPGAVDIGISRTKDSFHMPIETCALDFDAIASRLRTLEYVGADATVHALGGKRMIYEKGSVRIRVTYTPTREPVLRCVNVIEIEAA